MNKTIGQIMDYAGKHGVIAGILLVTFVITLVFGIGTLFHYYVTNWLLRLFEVNYQLSLLQSFGLCWVLMILKGIFGGYKGGN